MEWILKWPKWLRWVIPSAFLILIAGAILLPGLLRQEPRDESVFPFMKVSGKWADSLLTTLSTEQMVAQVIVQVYDAENGLKGITGLWFRGDSLQRLLRAPRKGGNPVLPLLRGTEGTNPVAEQALHLHPWQVLSNRDDSLILRYLDHHLLAARQAEMNMAIFPLELTLPRNLSVKDAAYFERNAKLTGYFIQKALSMGIIPVIPGSLVRFSNTGTPTVQDSLVITQTRKIVHPMVPAILLESIPAYFTQTYTLKDYLLKTYGFRGFILVRENPADPRALKHAIDAGADLVITTKIPDQADLPVAPQLNRATRNILYIKEWLLSATKHELPTPEVTNDSIARRQLQYQLLAGSVVRVQDRDGIIPFRTPGRGVCQLHLPKGSDYETFVQYLRLFAEVRVIRYPEAENIRIQKTQQTLILVEDSLNLKRLMNSKLDLKGIVVIYTGSLTGLTFLRSDPAVIWINRPDADAQQILANCLYGGASCNGIVPIKVPSGPAFGEGIGSFKPIRLNYTIPENAGVNPLHLLPIDSIIAEAIRNGAFPGCQVFATVDGKVIINKAYGHLTYEAESPEVTTVHLYDLASVTKAAATTLAVMRMYDQKRIRLNEKLGRIFKDHRIYPDAAVNDTMIREDTLILKGSRSRKARILEGHDTWRQLNDTVYLVKDTVLFTFQNRKTLFDVTVSSLLAHRSGLPPTLPVRQFMAPLWRFPVPAQGTEMFSKSFSKDSASLKVAEGMFLKNKYIDTLWNACKAIGINEKAGLIYSDANMIFLQMAIDTLNRIGMPAYLEEQIYRPLGLVSTCFNPIEMFSKNLIAPTADDLRWRRQLLQGNVYDPTAALLGGAAGNAGLFSNAADLGIIGQMLLQKGSYGGKQIFDSATVALFTSRKNETFQGLGFDLPAVSRSKVAPSASSETFGHTGFTGTVMWVDPVHRVVFVFLSNRIHPNPENQKIDYLQVRERVQEVIYQAIGAGI